MYMLMGNALVERAGAKALAVDDAAAAQPYTLTVKNESSRFQQFALFQTIPALNKPATSPLSLAWILGAAAPGSKSNPSTSQFGWQIDYAATTGYIQQIGGGSNPRRFSTATMASVGVDSDNSLNATYMGTFPYGAPAFPDEPLTGPTGMISVQADGTIPTGLQQSSQNMSLNVGICMNMKPTVAVQLEPNLLYQFTPKPTYYIISGSFVEGEVIDVARSSSAFKIAYEGVTDRTIYFTEANQFSNNP